MEGNSDVSLIVDSRVSTGSNEEKSNSNEHGLADVDAERKDMEDKGNVAEMAEMVKMDRKKPGGLEYNSMLSKFDEFANDGNSCSVGYGYEIGDMVWGKVKSHPWWPGHIYNEAFASASVTRIKTEGHILVAFFGDSSYGWFDPSELIPFELNFAEKSRQMNSKNFLKAVEEALDEVSRRSWLGLACRCRNPNNFRPTSVAGFFAVDVGDYEPAGIFSARQIKRARDSFQTQEMLAFVKKLALTPRTDWRGNIKFMKHMATVLAYRKAVFEEFDETYAQAFGAPIVLPEPRKKADLPQKETSRAPLSGPLVIAEALSKGKASGKPKARARIEKDKYLFKRRDEVNELRTQHTTKEQPGFSNQPVIIDGNSTTVKATSPSVADQMSNSTVSNVAEAVERPLHQSAPVEESGRVTKNPSATRKKKLHVEGSRLQTEVRPKKVKVHKRSAGEMSSESPLPPEMKKKKKKKISAEMSSDGLQTEAVGDRVDASMAKITGKLVQAPFSAGGEPEVNDQIKADAGKLVQPPLAAERDSKAGNKEDDAASAPVLSDSVEMRQTNSSSGAELRQFVSDLQDLALDPFLVLERSGPPTIQKVFLKFRSLVYEKSLALLPYESESSEALTSSSLATGPVSDNPPKGHVKEISSLKTEKSSSRPDDPTIGGRKRGPSERQEEMTAKKKKKINDLKSTTNGKKTVQKAAEASRGNTSGLPVKAAGPALTKAARSEAGKRTGMVVKSADPTMLVMKFPPGGALPSLPELKVKFARFGPLDHSRTRIYWQSSQCRLVYHQKSHAQEALKFATSSNNLFGNSNVRCYLRDLALETPDAEPTKVQGGGASAGTSVAREPGIEQRLAATLQLKSCLRKPSGDEGIMSSSGNGGGGRGARVKFMLGGEESNKSEQFTVGNRNINHNASVADGGASSSSSSSHPMDFNSMNFQKVITQPQSSIIPPSPPHFANSNETITRNLPNFKTPPALPPPITTMPSNTNVDIAPQMLSLLTKCNEVVNSLTCSLGYVAYRL